MNDWNEWSLAAIAWLGNLVLLGSVITITTAIVLRLMCSAPPRTRYFVALLAFLAAMLLPCALRRGDARHHAATAETAVVTALDSYPANERSTSRVPWERASFAIPRASGRFASGFLLVWALVATVMVVREIAGHW